MDTCTEELRYPEPVLCFVENGAAWFTTRDLAHQWGDDWDDAPYEHNAGAPYEFGEYDKKGGTAPWAIVKLRFELDWEEPCRAHMNSPYTVEEINRERTVPWLRTYDSRVVLYAGTPITTFVERVQAFGGRVYVALEDGALAERLRTELEGRALAVLR